MTIFKKKATDIQETKKLPMTGKVKKGFRAYCTMVIVGALALGMTTTAFAANDPLTVAIICPTLSSDLSVPSV